jgi:hypothetical protein
MPRRRAAAPVIPTTALVASSTRYPGKAARIYQPRQDWQRECYRHYAICGEARFGAKFFGNACSRAVLSSATPSDTGPVATPKGPASAMLDALFGGQDGQTQMLEAIGLHLTVAGECYLVGRQVEGQDTWEIVSVLEMVVQGTQWSIEYGDGLAPVVLGDDDVVIRIWLPNPARRIEADSAFRSLLPILGEIEWLTRHVFAQISSRLAGAGILMLPQGMTFPPPPDVNGVARETVNDADAFMLTLADAMMTPLQDPTYPAAMVPIVVTAPDDAIDKPRLLTFWSELDAAALELRTEAIRRFALGMDLPPEQILGMASHGGSGTSGARAGVSHWGAWQIEEATVKMHIEPMLDVIVNALTMGYLRPGLDDGATDFIVYDTSRLRLRPDRSKEAFELYDRGLLSIGALLRENGFDVDDLPAEAEFKRWLLVKIASGSATPEQVQAALGALGVDLGPILTDAIPRQSQPVPSLEDHPTRPRTPDEEQAPAASALLAASEALVFRALERAGNRLRQTSAKPPGVPAYETHVYVKANGTAERLLEDAWSCAPQVLDGIADSAVVVPVLNSYCMALLAEQSPHQRGRLDDWLQLAEVPT